MFITLEAALSPQGDALQSRFFYLFLFLWTGLFSSEVAPCTRTEISYEASCDFSFTSWD